jgi:hypothetical protein
MTPDRALVAAGVATLTLTGIGALLLPAFTAGDQQVLISVFVVSALVALA